MLRVTVTDSGIGLTPTQIGNLFQPFSQGDSSMTRRFGGTGLGLAISRRLVELMGGVIGVFSPGANLGSSFWFEIPVLVLEESAAAAEDPDGGITDFIWPTLPAIVRTATEDSTDGTAYAAPAPAVVSKHEDLSLDTSVIAEPAPIGTVDGDRTESEPRTPLSALSASSAELPTPTPLSANHSFGGGSAESSSLNPATRPGSKEPTRFQGRNILLAEDNNVNRLLVTKMLQKLGHTVTAVPDGEQAVEAARKKAAEDYQVAVESNGDTRNVGFEIILMDMMMPVMDGPTATRMIRQFPPHLNPQIPIVALSADALTESRERNQLSGLDSYVTKPVDWARLSRVMDRVIRAKQATRGAQGTGT
ncbi:CheY-like superfamily [Hyaloraphidium curvatum]|nr:CheY-like superfamily [Hyaloraphidium curvatum]